MKPGSFLAALSGGAATVANTIGNLTVEKCAAVVGIIAGACSIAVSLRNLLTSSKPAPSHVA